MLAEELNNFNRDNIIINDPIKNSVLQHSNFYKLSYSNNILFYNGIFILFDINNLNINNKTYKIDFNDSFNDSNKLIELEKYILNIVNIKNKIPQFKLAETFSSNNFKFSLSESDINFKNHKFLNNKTCHNKFIIKFSGIWETKDSYGITFKIINIKNILTIIDQPSVE